jgi:hypothetical protein
LSLRRGSHNVACGRLRIPVRSSMSVARMVAVFAPIALSAILWAGPAACADSSGPRALGSAAPSPPATYYIVPKTGAGAAMTLYQIAARTLGDGHRYLEIFDLNKGRLQPVGGRLTNPHVIEPGWVLQLPPGAAGAGVHTGPLPGETAASVRPAQRSPRPVAVAATASHPGISKAEALGAALIVVAVTSLTVTLSRARRRSARRPARKARRPSPGSTGSSGRTVGSIEVAPPGERSTGPWDPPGADHPSWPGAGAPNPLGDDHPSWPGAGPWNPLGDDHPSWPGAGALNPLGADHPSWPGAGPWNPLGDDHPSWPGAGQATWPRAIGSPAQPAPEPARALHHDPDPSTAPPPGQASAGGPGPGSLAPPPFAPPSTPRHIAPAPRLDSRPSGGTHRAVRTGHHMGQTVLSAGALADPCRGQAGDLWPADSARASGRMLAEADARAAAIVAAAEQEAAGIQQLAAERAAATLSAAECEAAEFRAAMLKLSTELTGVATHVTEDLAIPARPAAGTVALPATDPAAEPVTGSAAPESAAELVTGSAAPPAAQPAALPGTRPARDPQQDAAEAPARPGKAAARSAARRAAQPGARVAARSAARPGVSPRRTPKPRSAAKPRARQVSAMHKMIAAFLVLFLAGIVSGGAEIGLHGFSFFLFRNTGAGAGNSLNLEENQGPGQRHAPGTQHTQHTRHTRNTGKSPGPARTEPGGKASTAPGQSN